MATGPDRLSGTIGLLFLYDVCDEIRLDELRAILTRRGCIERQLSSDYDWPDLIRLSAEDLLARHGAGIARIVRGEMLPLDDEQTWYTIHPGANCP